MARALLLILAVVPGASPFLLGRAWLGGLLLVGGLNAWNLVLLGAVWVGDEALLFTRIGYILGILATSGSVAWTAVLTSPTRRKRHREIADRALELGQVAYLRGKPAAARDAIEAGLRRVHRDPDLLFLGWTLAREMNEKGRARRLLRRLRRVDVEGKWDWELSEMQETGGLAQ